MIICNAAIYCDSQHCFKSKGVNKRFEHNEIGGDVSEQLIAEAIQEGWQVKWTKFNREIKCPNCKETK